MDLDQIRIHWEKAGESLALSDNITPTSRDPYLGELEERAVIPWLEPGQLALDIGCGDASHTVKYAGYVDRIIGLDVSSSLLSLARKRMLDQGLEDKMELVAASILDLPQCLDNRKCDCIVSQRCLINLPDWEKQKEALLKIHDTLKPGGRLIMTEGFQDELDNLNQLRQSLNLTPINVVEYNRNLCHDEFDNFITQYFSIKATADYGLYIVLSRVFHPLQVYPDQPRHDSVINRTAFMMAQHCPCPDWKKYSYNLLYVLEKK